MDSQEEYIQEAAIWQDQGYDGEAGMPADHYHWTMHKEYPLDSFGSREDWTQWYNKEVEMAKEDMGHDRWGYLFSEIIEEYIVAVKVDGEHFIWDGNHRVGASFASGKSTIPALIGVPKTTKLSITYEQWVKIGQAMDWEEDEDDVDLEERGISADGDCFEVSAKHILYANPDDILVHGMVSGQGNVKGVRYRHAWCEDFSGGMVIDKSNGRDISMPKDVYYALGNINPKEVIKYNFEEVRINILDHEHWGPWEL